MSSADTDESKKDILSPGQGESINAEVLTPEVITEKKKRYTKSRKGMGGRRPIPTELDKPVVQNFISHLLKRRVPDVEIARLVNVPWSSFCRWKKKNLELWAQAQLNSDNPIKDVEQSLLDRAKGFYVERPIYDKAGNIKGTKFNYYPPDMSAIQYFLNNRSPADWKSKVEHNHAIEELPLEINFINGPQDNPTLPEPTIVGDGDQGKG